MKLYIVWNTLTRKKENCSFYFMSHNWALNALWLFKIVYSFIFGCNMSSLLHGLFSRCGERGLLSGCRAQASHFGGFSCCDAPAPCAQTSAVVVHGLRCSTTCEIFPNQGSNHATCIGRQILYHWTTREVPDFLNKSCNYLVTTTLPPHGLYSSSRPEYWSG